jgi:glutamate-1-semialdehyde 2,1-aminomutase
MTTTPTLFERATRVTPGGVHSPVRAFRGVGGTPRFVARGRGPYLIDVDGREYVDFCQSFGPLLLGHADPDVARAAHEAIDDGWTFGAAEPYSLALAEWITARVPWAERIRFVSSGTEAVMTALRIARAATGRSAILKFEGCYHGHTDAMLVRAGSGLAGVGTASSAGLPPALLADTLVATLDDEAEFARVIDRAGRELAAIIVEPMPANHGLLPQREAWLRRVVEMAAACGALVIFDEVITGFRVGVGGMAERLGLAPDLVCFGKVIGGGFPVGACAGRADLLDLLAPVGPVYQAGTLSANPVGMRAGLAALEKIDAGDGWRRLDAATETFAARLAEALAARQLDLHVEQDSSLFWIRAGGGGRLRRPADIPPAHAAWFPGFFHAALRRGVYLPPSPYEVGFMSLAHDPDTLARAADALADAAAEVAG